MVFLFGVAGSLVAAVQGYNLLAVSAGAPAPPFPLRDLLDRTLADPFGADGIWVTFMLLSTLLPTALHLLVALAGLATITTPPRLRHRLAAQLAGNPNRAQLDGPAFYFSSLWVVAAGLVVGAWVLLAWAIASVAEPVSLMLHDFAYLVLSWMS